MWASKWVVAYFITGKNTFDIALSKIGLRTSNVSGEINVSLAKTEHINVITFFSTPIFLLVIGFIIYEIVHIVIIKRKNNLLYVENSSQTCAVFFLVGLLPFAWYTVALNHSYEHYLFTNKACAVMLAAFIFAIVNIKENMRKKYKCKNILSCI